MKKKIKVSYNEFLKNWNKEEWEKIGRWETKNFTSSGFYLGAEQKYYDFFNIPLKPVRYCTVDYIVYDSKSDLDAIRKFFSDKIDAGEIEFIFKLIEKEYQVYNKLLKTYEVALKSSENLNEFTDKFERFIENLLFVTSTFEFERGLSDVLEEKLAKRLKELNYSNIYLAELLEEDKETDTSKLHSALKNLAKKILKNKLDMKSDKFKNTILNLKKKYSYLGTYLWIGKPYGEEDLIKIVDKAKSEIKNQTKKQKRPEFKDLFLNKLIRLTNLASRSKFRRVEVLNKTFSGLRPIILKYGKKGGLNSEEVEKFTLDEFINYLKSGLNNKNHIADYSLISYLTREKDVIFMSKEDGLKFRKEVLDKENKSDELKGNIAFHGTAKGYVKIIRSFKEFHKFEEGEVLVCNMTDPIYVPLMKKSSAIITDMGGVLSHAAIVSRELKKPCIIGTKIATKVLKDGDFVEVDANKGTIKILNKS